MVHALRTTMTAPLFDGFADAAGPGLPMKKSLSCMK